jgi:hypothetical protein
MIDRLPDNVLLAIFDFHRLHVVNGIPAFLNPKDWSRCWKMLTRVCQRWRYIVLGSPQRLRLRVLCTPTTPTRTLSDIWPPFPISVYGNIGVNEGVENLTVALKHRDRISEIYINTINGPGLERLIDVMREPLPTLTAFHLGSYNGLAPVLPETFLGRSAPHLQSFSLFDIPFPSFPKFILSATHTVDISLVNISHSGYISPDIMVTCLAALPNLKRFELEFRSRLSRPIQVGLPPLSRAILPALAGLSFKGTSWYFEDFLTRTRIPQLKWLYMQFFTELSYIPRVHQFIDRTEGLRPLGHAWVMFDWERIRIDIGLPTQIQLDILCEVRHRKLSPLVPVCHRFLPLSCVEHLTVCELYSYTPLDWTDDMDPSEWLELFRPFIAVRNMYVAKQFVPYVTTALQELTEERTMEVLPVLNNLSLEGFEAPGPVQEAIKPFVSARQLSNHPVIIYSDPPPQTS